jgi:hypothetical protein
MNLDRRAREYVTFALTDTPGSGTLEITFNNGTTWTAVTAAGGQVQVLLAGPDATSNPVETIVLAAGRNIAKFRATASPQVLIRTSAGAIDVA